MELSNGNMPRWPTHRVEFLLRTEPNAERLVQPLGQRDNEDPPERFVLGKLVAQEGGPGGALNRVSIGSEIESWRDPVMLALRACATELPVCAFRTDRHRLPVVVGRSRNAVSVSFSSP